MSLNPSARQIQVIQPAASEFQAFFPERRIRW